MTNTYMGEPTLRGIRNFDVERHQWKTRKPFTVHIPIYWMGFATDAAHLRSEGWILEEVENKATGSRKIYIRHPIQKLVGRISYIPEPKTVHSYCLDFLTPERNGKGRVKPPRFHPDEELREYLHDSSYAGVASEPDDIQGRIAHHLDQVIYYQNMIKPKKGRKKAKIIDLVEYMRSVA